MDVRDLLHPEDRAGADEELLEGELGAAELARVARGVAEVRTLLNRAPLVLGRRLRITPQTNPATLKPPRAGRPWLSLLVENPTAQVAEVWFDAGAQGESGTSDSRVPPDTGKILARRFEEVSIGFDPDVAIPAAGLELFAVRYDTLLQPSTYVYAPRAPAAERTIVVNDADAATVGVRLEYTVPAGRRARLDAYAVSLNGTPTLDARIVRGGATVVIGSSIGASRLDAPRLYLEAGDRFEIAVTAAGAAGATVDLLAAIEELDA